MPILEKREISVKTYMQERLMYTGWSPDKFERMCRNSLEEKKNFKIIDGTTEFTIILSNLEEYFYPPTPEAMDVAPIEEKAVVKPRTIKAKVKKK